MARHTPEVKLFIVQRLACFDTPEQTAKAVREEFGIEIARQTCEHYDPNKAAGQNLSLKLKKVFNDTRAKFLDDQSDIAVSHKSYRMRVLDRMIKTAESKGNMVLVASLLEQAAKEMGEHYTNRQKVEVTSPDGSVNTAKGRTLDDFYAQASNVPAKPKP